MQAGMIVSQNVLYYLRCFIAHISVNGSVQILVTNQSGIYFSVANLKA